MESLETVARRYKRSANRAVMRALYGEEGKIMIALESTHPDEIALVKAQNDARADQNRVLLPTPWAHLFVSGGFTPRAQFSASQLDKWYGCNYAWGLRYLLGLRKPEPQWGVDGSHLDPRDRSLAFGTALHKRLQDYFDGQPVDWTDEIGSRALTALPYLPQCPPVLTEQPIAFDSRRLIPELPVPVSFVGFKDLLNPEITYDYKSTGQVGGPYQKTASDLIQDPAANLYLWDDMNRLGTNVRKGRWVYIQSKGAHKAEPVDFEITRERAEPIVRMMIVQGVALRDEIIAYRNVHPEGGEAMFAAVEHLQRNTNTCKKYGGCEYHHSAGGPCRAELAANYTIPTSALAGITEQQQQQGQDMSGQQAPAAPGSIQDRLNRSREAATQQGQQPQQQAPQGFSPSAQSFAPPGQQQAPSGFPAQGFPPGPSFATPPAPQQTAPAFPPGQSAPPFGGFGGPPQQQQAPAPAAFGGPPQPAPFMGSPEQQLAAPLGAPQMPAAPAKRTRRTKAQIAAEAAGQAPQQPAAFGAAPIQEPAESDDDQEMPITVTLSLGNGEAHTVLAGPEIYDHLFAYVINKSKASLA